MAQNAKPLIATDNATQTCNSTRMVFSPGSLSCSGSVATVTGGGSGNVGIGTSGWGAYYPSNGSTVAANSALQYISSGVSIGSYNVVSSSPRQLVFGEYSTSGVGRPQFVLNSQANWFGVGAHNAIYGDGSEFRQGPLSDPPTSSWGAINGLESNYTIDSNVGIGTFAIRDARLTVSGKSFINQSSDDGTNSTQQITAVDGINFQSLNDDNGMVGHLYDNGGGNLIAYYPGVLTILSDQNIGQGVSCNNVDCSIHVVTNNYGSPDYFEFGIRGSGDGNGFINTNGISTGFIEVGDGNGTLGNLIAKNIYVFNYSDDGSGLALQTPSLSINNQSYFSTNGNLHFGITGLGVYLSATSIGDEPALVSRSTNTTSLNNYVDILPTGTSAWAGLSILANGGNLGVGTSLPSNLLEIGVRKLDVQSGGNVGIGSINPGQLLDVKGTVRANSLSIFGGTSSQFLKANGTTDSTSYSTATVSSGTINQEAIYTASTTLGSGIITDNATNVGISSTSPGALFDVKGNSRIANGVQLNSQSTAPTIASNDCGTLTQGTMITSPTSTDMTGAVTAGTAAGNILTCSISFGLSHTSAPANCTCNDKTTPLALAATSTSTKVTCTSLATLASAVIGYNCNWTDK